MSNKISELPQELPYPLQVGDWIPVSRGDTTYKADLAKIFNRYIKFVPNFEGYVIVPGQGNTNIDIVQANDIIIGKGGFFAGAYVMARALQDEPTEDAHFKTGLNNIE